MAGAVVMDSGVSANDACLGDMFGFLHSPSLNVKMSLEADDNLQYG